MAIHLEILGIPIRCDNAEEALALIRSAGKPQRKGDKSKNDRSSGMDSADGEYGPNIAGFWATLEKQVQGGLIALRDSSGGLKTDEFAKALKVEPAQIKYLMKTAKAVATRNGIEWDEVVQRETAYEDSKPISIYKMDQDAKSLLAHMK